MPIYSIYYAITRLLIYKGKQLTFPVALLQLQLPGCTRIPKILAKYNMLKITEVKVR
jgi:hypothetical protein